MPGTFSLRKNLQQLEIKSFCYYNTITGGMLILEYKTCEQYVLAELNTAQKLLETIKEYVQSDTLSDATKITVIAELLSLHTKY